MWPGTFSVSCRLEQMLHAKIHGSDTRAQLGNQDEVVVFPIGSHPPWLGSETNERVFSHSERFTLSAKSWPGKHRSESVLLKFNAPADESFRIFLICVELALSTDSGSRWRAFAGSSWIISRIKRPRRASSRRQRGVRSHSTVRPACINFLRTKFFPEVETHRSERIYRPLRDD